MSEPPGSGRPPRRGGGRCPLLVALCLGACPGAAGLRAPAPPGRSGTSAGGLRPEPRLRFLSIQKTGSTTFAEAILSQFCEPGQPCGNRSVHLDWNEATRNGSYKGAVVTLLRDPVERALSEFFYLRSPDGRTSAAQHRWDFRNASWVAAIQDQNLSKALDAFIHGYPKNPSRNRQALYVLGFRVLGNRSERNRSVAPGEVYDWDVQPGKLAQRAMAKLENLTAFGIVDCWNASLRAIGRALHWDPDKIETVLEQRRRGNWKRDLMTHEDFQTPSWDERALRRRKPAGNRGWTDVVPARYIGEIKRWSHVDMLLYAMAKERFSEKFGQRC